MSGSHESSEPPGDRPQKRRLTAREKHAAFVKNSACRAAMKAAAGSDQPLTVRALAGLKIQTWEPWKRLLTLAGALLTGWGAIALWQNGSLWLSGLLFALAIFLLFCALLGRRRTMEALGEHLPGAVIEIIVGLATS